jgi:anti-sigma factor RsiW
MNALDCTDIKALLSALIDDQLDEHTRHQVERHLAECDACRAQVNEHERLDALVAMSAELSAHGSPGLPRGFEQTVLAQTVRAEE